MQLTANILERVEPHSIFMAGVFEDVLDGVNLVGDPGRLLKWVAVRGEIPDWALYVGPYEWSWSKVQVEGDKVLKNTAARITGVFDHELMKRYRS